jgi:Phospholipase_D-nuclease N-terminal/Short C-terminal domain
MCWLLPRSVPAVAALGCGRAGVADHSTQMVDVGHRSAREPRPSRHAVLACGGSHRIVRDRALQSKGDLLFVGADYPFLDVLWTMIVIFAWVIWFWLLITVFADLFRRHDTSGFTKVLWIIFVIITPFLGVLIYLLVNNHGMTERNLENAKAQKQQFDAYVRDAAGGSAAEIEKAKGLLDSGAINQSEFEAIKAKALAT